MCGGPVQAPERARGARGAAEAARPRPGRAAEATVASLSARLLRRTRRHAVRGRGAAPERGGKCRLHPFFLGDLALQMCRKVSLFGLRNVAVPYHSTTTAAKLVPSRRPDQNAERIHWFEKGRRHGSTSRGARRTKIDRDQLRIRAPTAWVDQRPRVLLAEEREQRRSRVDQIYAGYRCSYRTRQAPDSSAKVSESTFAARSRRRRFRLSFAEGNTAARRRAPVAAGIPRGAGDAAPRMPNTTPRGEERPRGHRVDVGRPEINGQRGCALNDGSRRCRQAMATGRGRLPASAEREIDDGHHDVVRRERDGLQRLADIFCSVAATIEIQLRRCSRGELGSTRRRRARPNADASAGSVRASRASHRACPPRRRRPP